MAAGSQLTVFLQGEIENKLANFQADHNSNWSSVSARPWAVTKGDSVMKFLMPSMYIPVDELSAAMVSVALTGIKQVSMENVELKATGKAARKVMLLKEA